jgi:hypothetical protein
MLSMQNAAPNFICPPSGSTRLLRRLPPNFIQLTHRREMGVVKLAIE